MKKYIFTFITMIFMTALIAAQDKVKIEGDQTYLILSTKKIETMEKELDEVSAKGFRVLYGAPTVSYDMAIFLQRLDKTETAPYSYKILATSLIKTMEKELNENAAQGYRLLPRTIVFKQGFFTAELVTLMERAPNSAVKYDYKLVAAGKETKLHQKIDAAIAEGYAPTTMITLGAHVIVMEKEVSTK